jgi:hypothetical protein
VPNTIVSFEEVERSCLVSVVVGAGPVGNGTASAVGDTGIIVLLAGVKVVILTDVIDILKMGLFVR